jgi:hypothetical protein
MIDNQNANLKPCKHCGHMMAKSAKVCPNCGGKNKPPIYKRPWFIAIAVIFVLGLIGSIGGGKSSNSGSSSTTSSKTETTSTSSQEKKEAKTAEEKEEVIEYTHYEVSEMMDDLNGNAMKAQSKYKDQYIEITGRLSNIDSDGKYISVTRSDDEWAILGVHCTIKTEDQRNQIMDMTIGDTVTIRGKCTDVGEVLGYYLDIQEID